MLTSESQPVSDTFDLERFVLAQQDDYPRALAELKAGRKHTHWMWYIFPQLRGLGSSAMSQRYGISSLAEAKAYLVHPVLGPRLLECATAVLTHRHGSARAIFGSPDDLKLRSSATLFARASVPGSVFERILTQFFAGEEDQATIRLLQATA